MRVLGEGGVWRLWRLGYHFTNARQGESLAAGQGVIAPALCMVIEAERNQAGADLCLL